MSKGGFLSGYPIPRKKNPEINTNSESRDKNPENEKIPNSGDKNPATKKIPGIFMRSRKKNRWSENSKNPKFLDFGIFGIF